MVGSVESALCVHNSSCLYFLIDRLLLPGASLVYAYKFYKEHARCPGTEDTYMLEKIPFLLALPPSFICVSLSALTKIGFVFSLLDNPYFAPQAYSSL